MNKVKPKDRNDQHNQKLVLWKDNLLFSNQERENKNSQDQGWKDIPMDFRYNKGERMSSFLPINLIQVLIDSSSHILVCNLQEVPKPLLRHPWGQSYFHTTTNVSVLWLIIGEEQLNCGLDHDTKVKGGGHEVSDGLVAVRSVSSTYFHQSYTRL